MQINLVIAVLAWVAGTHCAPRPQAAGGAVTPPIPIISSNSELRQDGSYVYNFQTGNEITVEEEGTIKKAVSPATPEEENIFQTGNEITVEEEGTIKKAVSPATPEEENVIAVKGKYSYKTDDGTLIELTYSADDETGFVAQGAHLPTAPPIPEAIRKALEYIASQPSTPEPSG